MNQNITVENWIALRLNEEKALSMLESFDIKALELFENYREGKTRTPVVKYRIKQALLHADIKDRVDPVVSYIVEQAVRNALRDSIPHQGSSNLAGLFFKAYVDNLTPEKTEAIAYLILMEEINKRLNNL